MTKGTTYDVIIVGGGLSGLLTARLLRNSHPNKGFLVLEAGPSLGGRLRNDSDGRNVDLGGAWIWPDYQPGVSDLVEELGIRTFPQPGDDSAARLVGGAAEIIDRLRVGVPEDRIRMGAAVVSCRRIRSDADDASDTMEVETAGGETIRARHVVFAAPPKIISARVKFDPPLSPAKARAMSDSRTWMAGVTKVALIYDSGRFWPEDECGNRGLRPGRGRPAFQVYDGSPSVAVAAADAADGGGGSSIGVLTFFALASLIGGSSSGDDEEEKVLARECADQLASSLSKFTVSRNPDLVDKLRRYSSYHVQRWPREGYISDDPDPHQVHPHPSPVAELAEPEWDGGLLFAGTETDSDNPGVMEGAVGSAARVSEELERIWMWEERVARNVSD